MHRGICIITEEMFCVDLILRLLGLQIYYKCKIVWPWANTSLPKDVTVFLPSMWFGFTGIMYIP